MVEKRSENVNVRFENCNSVCKQFFIQRLFLKFMCLIQITKFFSYNMYITSTLLLDISFNCHFCTFLSGHKKAYVSSLINKPFSFRLLKFSIWKITGDETTSLYLNTYYSLLNENKQYK